MYVVYLHVPFVCTCNFSRRNGAGWHTKQTIKIDSIMPEHPSMLSYKTDHAVYTRYQCLRECSATKYAFHFFQSQLTCVWYGEKFHSHSVAVSAKHTQLRLSPDAARQVDEELLRRPANYVHNKLQGLAMQANLTPLQASNLPQLQHLSYRRTALLSAVKELNNVHMFEKHR